MSIELQENTSLCLPKPNYNYITTEEDARRAMNVIDKYSIIGVDTEATGLDPFSSKTVLVQIGLPNKAYIFDVRHDTEHSSLHLDVLKPLLVGNEQVRILQNAVYDMKMIRAAYGFYIENIYDTMLTENLLNLGLHHKASLDHLVNKYLGLTMTKQPRETFKDYSQKFQSYQLEYAASDTIVLHDIRNCQLPFIKKHSFEDVCRLEFEFTKPMCEMEFNGMRLDVKKWRAIMGDTEKEMVKVEEIINNLLTPLEDQTTLFGVSLIDINSPLQLKKALNKLGLPLENTRNEELSKYKGVHVVDAILEYRKYAKLISTYAEPVIERIHSKTGRLHTKLKQMVATGRLSSSDPNLQNIPKKQIYRSCFIAEEGNVLITADMSGAELRILGNLSKDHVIIDAYKQHIDLHTKTASDIFGVSMDKVTDAQRDVAKTINFGIIYGLSEFGLARRLRISEKKAEEYINIYFKARPGVKKYLNNVARDAVYKRYSKTVSGRKRFYRLPEYSDPSFNKIKRSVERRAKNAGIQGSLVFNTCVKGLGFIGSYVDKEIKLETGFGSDTAKGVYSDNKYVYDLKLSNGVELGITLEHKIPTVSKNSGVEVVKDVSVESLTKDDLIMIPLSIVEGGSITDLSGYKYEKGHWRETFINYTLPKKMTPNLAFVIGCLIGDGNYSKYNNINFVCPTKHRELFDKFNNCVYELFGYKPIIGFKHKNVVNKLPLPFSQTSSVVIRGFLKHIGLDYVVHHNKRIPDYFYMETVENRGALLNGLFSTDGGFTKKSGPNFTNVSRDVANSVHQLLFSLGINSNLKIYNEKKSVVYRLQIPKRFNEKFKRYIGFSVDDKQEMLSLNCTPPKFSDDSIVPEFIPKTIEKVFRKSPTFFADFSVNEKAHLRRFKLGKCSYSSWRKFYKKIPECKEKEMLSKYLNYDFCVKKSLSYRGKEDTYDLMCDNIYYFIANGVIVHNSNADTIKQAMIYLVDRLEKSGYDARLVLTVHDEVVVETKEEQKYEVAELVEQAVIDGFGHYFHLIPMETQALIGPCWLKNSCKSKDSNGKKCGGTEMISIPTSDKYGSRVVCKKCGGEI